mgnify:CR=1 FL=1
MLVRLADMGRHHNVLANVQQVYEDDSFDIEYDDGDFEERVGVEMLKELKLDYNRTRQAAITKEILEIVGGAEALNN